MEKQTEEKHVYECRGCAVATTNRHGWCNECNKPAPLHVRMYEHAISERMERGD